jgi:hypothetical protein
MDRAAAKAMALVEATNDYFEELMELIEKERSAEQGALKAQK